MSSPQMNFRVDSSLRAAFIAEAQKNGMSASEVLIQFMQEYVGVGKYSSKQSLEERVKQLEEQMRSLM